MFLGTKPEKKSAKEEKNESNPVDRNENLVLENRLY